MTFSNSFTTSLRTIAILMPLLLLCLAPINASAQLKYNESKDRLLQKMKSQHQREYQSLINTNNRLTKQEDIQVRTLPYQRKSKVAVKKFELKLEKNDWPDTKMLQLTELVWVN